MTAELKLMSFTSGTATGQFTGSHTVAFTVLCGVSGTATIPLRCTNDGILFISGIN